jgi:hypothetical protein
MRVKRPESRGAAASGSKSLLVLFFRKEQDSSFSEEKEAKRLCLLSLVYRDPGLGRRMEC